VSDDLKLERLLDDPEIRDMIFALCHSGHSARAAGPVRLREVAAGVLATADPEQLSSWLDAGDRNARVSPEQVAVLLTDDVVVSVAAYIDSDPAEVTRQLAQLLPDLLDALTPSGELLPAPELARIMRIDIALDDESAGAFGL
jgi:YidB-like protein